MSDPRHTLGQRGELFVADQMLAAGYTILARNWRHAPTGEIDIVARTASSLVFVEVRTRRGPLQTAIDAALESITATKRTRLAQLAELYRQTHNITALPWRVDIAAVAEHDGRLHLHVITDALAW